MTIVIPSSGKGNKFVTSHDHTIGLRIPNSYLAQSLLSEIGPLLTSSANISGFKGSITAEGIALEFPSVDILRPVPWDKGSGKASTIIFWVNNRDWRLIRQGEVLMKELF